MGKASRRKRQQRSSSHGDRTHPAAAEVPAPNFDRTAVQAIRDALAMITSVHASPQDLPGLAEELAADRGRQGLVADALVSRFITQSARELAGARGITVPAALEGITASLQTGDAEHHTALNRALATVRTYAEALDDLRPPGTLTADLDASLGPGPASAERAGELVVSALDVNALLDLSGVQESAHLSVGISSRRPPDTAATPGTLPGRPHPSSRKQRDHGGEPPVPVLIGQATGKRTTQNVT
jgi:hypothetical protein